MKKEKEIHIDGLRLSIPQIVAVARGSLKVILEGEVKARLDKSSKQLAKAVREAIVAGKD